MRVITWNVNGIRAREREVLELASRHGPDVLCLQEIKSSPEQLPPGLGGLVGLPEFTSFWHGKGGYSGVSIHLRKASFAEPVKFSHPSFDHENASSSNASSPRDSSTSVALLRRTTTRSSRGGPTGRMRARRTWAGASTT